MSDCNLDLEDLLADPLVRMVMASDGVDEGQIRRLALRIAPHQAAARALAGDRGDQAGSLRHTPSCRGSWRSASSVQPSA